MCAIKIKFVKFLPPRSFEASCILYQWQNNKNQQQIELDSTMQLGMPEPHNSIIFWEPETVESYSN